MRQIFARLGLEAEPPEPPLLLGLKIEKRRLRLDPRDDRARPGAAEQIEPLEADERRGPTNLGEGLDHVPRHARIDVADEAQGDVVVRGLHPARAHNAAAREGDLRRDALRNFQSREKTRHGPFRRFPEG